MIRIFIIALLAICISLISETSADCSDSSCLGGILSSEPSADYDSLRRVYIKVNDYVVDKFPDEKDPEKSLEKAIEWLETKPKKLLSKNPHLVALEHLKSLKTLKADTDCGSKSLKIMHNNNMGTKFRANRQRKWLEPPRRIDSIVRYYSDEHVKICLKIYPIKFATKYKLLGNNERVRLVEGFVRGHIYGDMKYIQSHYNNFRWTHDNLEAIKHPNWRKDLAYLMSGKYYNATEVYDFIVHFGKSDPDVKFMRRVLDEKKGQMIVREDKIEALVKKYFVEPCNYYMQTFGPEIFEPAAYDAKMEDEELKYLGNDYIASQFDFYFGLECFQICSTLSYRARSLPEEVSKVAEDPEDRSGRY